MVDGEQLLSRVRDLSPREAQMFLLSEVQLTMQDVGDALDMSSAAVSRVRQGIRRKLAVPKGTSLAAFLNEPRVRDTAREAAGATTSPALERRRRDLLRSSIHELDVTLRRIAAKEKTLHSLASHAAGRRRAELVSEAAEVSAIVQRLGALRDETVASARSVSPMTG